MFAKAMWKKYIDNSLNVYNNKCPQLNEDSKCSYYRQTSHLHPFWYGVQQLPCSERTWLGFYVFCLPKWKVAGASRRPRRLNSCGSSSLRDNQWCIVVWSVSMPPDHPEYLNSRSDCKKYQKWTVCPDPAISPTGHSESIQTPSNFSHFVAAFDISIQTLCYDTWNVIQVHPISTHYQCWDVPAPFMEHMAET